LSLYKTGYKEYYQEPYTDKQYIKDWELGLPLSITDYDQNGNVQTITTNSYTFSPVDLSSYTKVENVKKLNIVEDNGALTVKASEAYRPYTGSALLNRTTILKYITNSSTITDEVTYTYDGKKNLKTITTKDSRGVYSYNNNIYNYDVTSPAGTTLYNMTANGLEKVVSTERWRKNPLDSPNNNLLMDASIIKYSYQTGKLFTQKQFVLQNLAPILYSTYNGAGGANLYGKILAAYNTTLVDPTFQVTSEVLETDAKGHALEMRLLDKNIYQSMIWDPVSGNMVASVENARLKDIAFTSFESFIYNDPVSYTGNEAIVNGGFTYKHMGLNYPGNAISGKAIYRLSPATYIKSKELTSGQTYTLTFWCKDGVPSFSGVGTTITPEEESQANGWKYYRATFTPAQTGILNFASTPIISVDEVRLFPADALMTNSTYNPLFGASSIVDPTGRITYFEYDAFGRLVMTKDQDGNVVAKKEYHIGQ
jgi:YD repeat-containing protein